ncbi:MAG: hypothetical protein P1U52_06400 [Porticoccaceae bacterium]|nr:hypothetical protein [Porticoccaceae bacterium]
MPDHIDDNSKDGDAAISPEKFSPIKAADIPLSKPLSQGLNPEAGPSNTSAASPGHATPANSSRRLIYGATLLALACVLALFLLTFYQDAPTKATTDLVADKATSPTAHKPTIEEKPFERAQLAAARRSAQDILARVLEKKQTLETLSVQHWAATQYQQALAIANQGDTLYRKRDFKAAISHYERAESQLNALEAGRQPHIEELLSQGLMAINQGRGESAQQAFEKVILIEENHPQALLGLQRSATAPEVFAATQRGDALSLSGDYTAALAEYTQALNLDPLFEAAISGREKAQGLRDDRQFESAINQGFQSLHSGDFNTARKQFSQALILKPESDIAQGGLAQVKNEIAQRAISRLINSAETHERNEQWQMALDTYDNILSRDSSVTAATVGKIRSTARQQLDAKLETFIHQPLRLASPAVFREAQQSLRDAQQIVQAGPRLKQQIDALHQTLAKAQQPQTVVLHSDNLTRVRLFKVAEFAPFHEKTLQLKPGKYTAEGIRPGYRDVRVEFTVPLTAPGANPTPIVVQCREAI